MMGKINDSLEVIQKIASDFLIDRAYDWLCKMRKDYSHNDEVWDIRFRWPEFKPHLQKTLLSGQYYISSQIVIKIPDRRTELWNAQDALVLKAMSIVFGEYLKPVLSRNCYHLAGHGCAKAAVRAIAKHLEQWQHIMKSDVRSYYATGCQRIQNQKFLVLI